MIDTHSKFTYSKVLENSKSENIMEALEKRCNIFKEIELNSIYAN